MATSYTGGSKSRNFKRFGIPAALVIGGVTAGSLFAPLGLASAQDDDAEGDADTSTEENDSGSSDSDSTVDGEDGKERREGRRARHRARHQLGAEAVTEALGLTGEEVRAGLDEGKTIAELADEQGVSREDLIASLSASITDRIDQAVEDGKLDADRAAEMLAGVEARVTELIDSDPEDLHRYGDGRHREQAAKFRQSAEEVQDLLGLTAEEMRAALADGQSLADLAEQQGVPIDELTDLLVANATERVDQAVEDGKLDAERAEDLLENLEERIEARINGELDGRPGGLGGRGHHGGHGHGNRGPGGDAGVDGEPESSVEESSLQA